MAEDISGTLKKKSLDGIFNEVPHTETLGISNNEELRLFYLKVREKNSILLTSKPPYTETSENMFSHELH